MFTDIVDETVRRATRAPKPTKRDNSSCFLCLREGPVTIRRRNGRPQYNPKSTMVPYCAKCWKKVRFGYGVQLRSWWQRKVMRHVTWHLWWRWKEKR